MNDNSKTTINISEKELQKACIKWLDEVSKQYDIFYTVNHTAGRFKFNNGKIDAIPNQNAGMADITFIYKGLVYFIELKSATGRQQKNQKEFQAKVIKTGARYNIIKTVESFQELILLSKYKKKSIPKLYVKI